MILDPWLKEGKLGHWDKKVMVKFALRNRFSPPVMSP